MLNVNTLKFLQLRVKRFEYSINNTKKKRTKITELSGRRFKIINSGLTLDPNFLQILNPYIPLNKILISCTKILLNAKHTISYLLFLLPTLFNIWNLHRDDKQREIRFPWNLKRFTSFHRVTSLTLIFVWNRRAEECRGILRADVRLKNSPPRPEKNESEKQKREATLFIAVAFCLLESPRVLWDFYGSRDCLRISALPSLSYYLSSTADRVKILRKKADTFDKSENNYTWNFKTHRCRGCSDSPDLVLELTMAFLLVRTLKQNVSFLTIFSFHSIFFK